VISERVFEASGNSPNTVNQSIAIEEIEEIKPQMDPDKRR